MHPVVTHLPTFTGREGCRRLRPSQRLFTKDSAARTTEAGDASILPDLTEPTACGTYAFSIAVWEVWTHSFVWCERARADIDHDTAAMSRILSGMIKGR